MASLAWQSNKAVFFVCLFLLHPKLCFQVSAWHRVDRGGVLATLVSHRMFSFQLRPEDPDIDERNNKSKVIKMSFKIIQRTCFFLNKITPAYSLWVLGVLYFDSKSNTILIYILQL